MEGRGGRSGDQQVQLAEEEEEEETAQGSGISSCPSFSSYSSRRLPLEASGPDPLPKEFDEDFEFFPVVGDHDDGLVIDPDRIGPVFPVFNRDLLLEDGAGGGGGETQSGSIMIPLRDLFMEEEEEEEEENRQSSSSEADGDDLEGIPEGTYCVWTPRGGTGGCRKSKSTGSRRWRFLDLVRRSNSERKDSSSFVLLTPSDPPRMARPEKRTAAATSGEGEGSKSGMEVLYTRKKVGAKGGGGGRRSSNLQPYRRRRKEVVVGFFANVNGFARTFPPFG